MSLFSKWNPITDNLDFENLSNSLFQEWNNFDNSNAKTDDTKATESHKCQTSHRNRIELETIFQRVGLQMNVACRLADEVYNKLGLNADQTIGFTDFLTLIGQYHSESDVIKQTINKNTDEYTISPLNDHMIFDMHAGSGLFYTISLSLSLITL